MPQGPTTTTTTTIINIFIIISIIIITLFIIITIIIITKNAKLQKVACEAFVKVAHIAFSFSKYICLAK